MPLIECLIYRRFCKYLNWKTFNPFCLFRYPNQTIMRPNYRKRKTYWNCRLFFCSICWFIFVKENHIKLWKLNFMFLVFFSFSFFFLAIMNKTEESSVMKENKKKVVCAHLSGYELPQKKNWIHSASIERFMYGSHLLLKCFFASSLWGDTICRMFF